MLIDCRSLKPQPDHLNPFFFITLINSAVKSRPLTHYNVSYIWSWLLQEQSYDGHWDLKTNPKGLIFLPVLCKVNKTWKCFDASMFTNKLWIRCLCHYRASDRCTGRDCALGMFEFDAEAASENRALVTSPCDTGSHGIYDGAVTLTHPDGNTGKKLAGLGHNLS